MSFDSRFLDEIRSRLTLSEIVGQRITLKRAGREHKACCPFHNEKTPSFTVNDAKQFYHCFGCGAHGDVIGFVMQYDNLSFIDAVENLASRAGLQIPRTNPEERQRDKKRKDIYHMLSLATQWFQEQLNLPANREAKEYVLSRGITLNSISSFKIGYAPSDAHDLKSLLLKEGFGDDNLIDAGLYKKSEKTGNLYPFFRERVLFPVTDRRGRVVAFGGRVLPDHMRQPDNPDFKPPKYLNSPDSPIFHKGSLLYAQSQAAQAVVQDHRLIVVEGYTDVISCHQAGFRGAVAPLGTALTEEQVLAMWRLIPHDEKMPLVCFDGDEAGMRAAERVCDRILPLLEADRSLLFVFMPSGEDPDSLIKGQGEEAFRRILNSAMPLSDFLWQREYAGRDFSVPEARAGLENRLKQKTLLIKNRNVQYYYQQIIRQKIKLAFYAPRASRQNKSAYPGQSRKSQQNSQTHLSAQVSPPGSRTAILREKILLAALINHPEIYNACEDTLETVIFKDDRLDSLRQNIIFLLSNDANLNRERVINTLKENGFDNDLENILSTSVYLHAGFAKPGSDPEKVTEGLIETVKYMGI